MSQQTHATTRRTRRRWLACLGIFALTTTAVGTGVTSRAYGAVGADDYTAPGTIQTALGCAKDWDPACEASVLKAQPTGIYSLPITLPEGDYEFKIAQGGSWDKNWGSNGQANGSNIAVHSDGSPAHIYFDPATGLAGLVPDNQTVVVAGSMQKALGCSGDWAPDCRMPILFPQTDGTYLWRTDRIPAGAYEAKVAIGGSWDVNYGQGGAAGGANYEFQIADGKPVTFVYDPKTHVLSIASSATSVAGFGQLRAYWVNERTIALPADLVPSKDGDPAVAYSLVNSPYANATLVDGGITGDTQSLDLTSAGPLDAATVAQYPHLTGYTAYTLPDKVTTDDVKKLLIGQNMIAGQRAGQVVAFTGIQLAPVLDALYAGQARNAELGATLKPNGSATFRLWAPTAQTVGIQMDLGHGNIIIPASKDAQSGIWTVESPENENMLGKTYLWNVSVYSPVENKMLNSYVTDPYSKALTVDSKESVVTDLSAARLIPQQWATTPAPQIRNDSARNIYELHIRDFSIADQSVAEKDRGTYMAFTYADSAGMKHLRDLSAAGMNTIHLLPSFDITTIPELRANQAVPTIPAAGPDSPDQQEAVSKVADTDGFNWGYDPYHYQTPEGSYTTDENQNGDGRTYEFRAMVGGLHAAGYQVVLDQVYNHSSASGDDEKSVLDKIVPDYYHRLSNTGKVENSTCCANLATENVMMEKLMVDSLVTWARDYHVDGFRFDLMGHHSVKNMQAARAALDALTLDKDGVDGKSIYMYGEGWNFGEVADNARFIQAKQGQLDGTGIGSFNDRLRDAVHGGGPFDSDVREFQGFGNGLFSDPNGIGKLSPDEQKARLVHSTDLIRLGMAGNLKDYSFTTADGTTKRGEEIDYNGQHAGFASEPAENVNYVDAHDNETLFDLNVMKLPTSTSMNDRVRMNIISLAPVTWGQSPVFWHAGTDILRSKSLDRDSYNSGDYFNAIDWTMQDNGFGHGLPVKSKNGEKWSWMAPLLRNADLKPTHADMEKSTLMAQELLKVRSSSPLFSLGSAALIRERVTFPGSGPQAVPGLLLMHIEDKPGTVATDIDSAHDGALIAINATPQTQTQTIAQLAGRTYTVNDIQANGVDASVIGKVSWDAATGTISVPGRTAVVLFANPSPTPQPQPQPTPQPQPAPTPSQPIIAEGDAPSALPNTGAAVGMPILIAAGLTAAGVIMVALRQRRR
ncbi:pullulanase-type alpha-1,6-glucosidase [Trueperella sp. LYQ141]|uniref:pullulanase-type alpha-1,6-glucosidase n=1 Tax=Trueperella sp. LYQ141 TaxID=3391058 RepID=UPI0039833549